MLNIGVNVNETGTEAVVTVGEMGASPEAAPKTTIEIRENDGKASVWFGGDLLWQED